MRHKPAVKLSRSLGVPLPQAARVMDRRTSRCDVRCHAFRV